MLKGKMVWSITVNILVPIPGFFIFFDVCVGKGLWDFRYGPIVDGLLKRFSF